MSEEMRFRFSDILFISRKSDGSYFSDTECVISIEGGDELQVTEKDAKCIIKIMKHYLEES